MKVLACLRSDIPALDIGLSQLKEITKAFPSLYLETCDTYEELREKISDAVYVLTWRLDADLYPNARLLRSVFTPAAGRDWVAPDPSGRVKVHYGTFHGTLISQALLGAMLYFNLRLPFHLQNKDDHRYPRADVPLAASLAGQSVLIVGFGNIGAHCAKVLRHHGCGVAGTRRIEQAYNDSETGARVVPYRRLSDYLPRADHVIDLLPGGQATLRAFSDNQFGAMKPGAYFYNFGRGSTVDEKSLCQALTNGRLAGAALDVFEKEPLPEDSPLWDIPNLLITPHSSCFYPEYGKLFVGEVIAHLARICSMNHEA